MAAIVLNGEETQEERCIEQRNGERQPVAKGQRQPCDGPKENKWTEGDQQFGVAAQCARFTVVGKNPDPILCILDIELRLEAVRG